MAFIGLDVGTSGAKATVLDKTGNTLFSATGEYDLTVPGPGLIEIDPSVVVRGCKEALGKAARGYNGPIEAIATASFGEACAMLDEYDRPVLNSIFYTDVRGNDKPPVIRAALRDPDEYCRRAGMPVNSWFTLPKLLWIRDERPALFSRIRTILPYGAYINYILSGEKACDSSQASRTLLFDIVSMEWSREALDAFGLSPSLFPRYAPAGTPVGRMRQEIADELGFKNRPLIVSGVHDQVAASLGAGSVAPGDISDGIGSAECLTCVLPPEADVLGMQQGAICTEPSAIPGQYVALAFTASAGASLKWYRDRLLPDVKRDCEEKGISAYAAMNSRLSRDPSPVLFLPHLAGTGTPYADPLATGLLSGLTLATTREDIYRAIIEGMGYEIRLNLELMARNGFRFDHITATGGGASREALQIRSDILGLPFRTLENPESGTVGMAMIAATAAGEYRDFREAVSACVRVNGVIEPDLSMKARYDERFEAYRRLYDAQRAIYGR